MPHATTVWLFPERLVKAKAIDQLFARFDAALTDQAIRDGGQSINATVVPALRQRNIKEEKAAIKNGRIPSPGRTSQPRSGRSQRRHSWGESDRDARWSIKYIRPKVKEGGNPEAVKLAALVISMLGYKNYIGIDRVLGLIRT
jgi:IS5 family transposase